MRLIKDKHQLYDFFENKYELDLLIIPFMDSMEDLYNGCRCKLSQYEKTSDNEYQMLLNQNELLLKYYNIKIT